MNILEEIQNCHVEWKELGEVCEFINGFALKVICLRVKVALL